MQGISWAAIVFWVGVFTWFSIQAWASYLRDRERQQTLRTLLERGIQLDPAMMERLFPASALPGWMPKSLASEEKETRDLVRGLTIGGVIVVAVGIGLLIGAQLVGQIQPKAIWGMSTGGAITLCAGLGLLISAAMVRRQSDPGANTSPVDSGQ